MAQKDRSKEIWLIPKRANLHQTVCLIDGIVERNYDGKSWNESKQNDLGVNLRKWGATKTGKNISSQAIRTLVASVPQYLGFLFINTKTTPSTISLTQAGYDLLRNHQTALKRQANLVKGREYQITSSSCVLHQMVKLQITNPIIAKDCEGILVFPFRMTLKLLLELKYLDREEIAYFLLHIKDQNEFYLKLMEIKNFRKLQPVAREALIEAYKKTHLGNITLVQASSASYYESLCSLTGIIDRFRLTPVNSNKSLSAIKIKDECESMVQSSIISHYDDIVPYDFSDNLDLWIEYIGNPDRVLPPVDYAIHNKSEDSVLIQLSKNSVVKYIDLITSGQIIKYPVFLGEEYNIDVREIDTGKLVLSQKIEPAAHQQDFTITGFAKIKHSNETPDQIANRIIEHNKAKDFERELLGYLKVLELVTGVDKRNDSSLRGAHLEHLFYLLLNELRNRGLISDVYWYGKIGKFGLPIAAPGGKTGTPDIVFIMDGTHFVLELTTMKSKSSQERAEASSVPDHIKIYKQTTGAEKVVGIFCAPIIHERVKAMMEATLREVSINLLCLTDIELITKLLKPVSLY